MWAGLKQTNWLIVAGVLTVAYAGGLIWLLGWSRIATFLTTGNDLNSVGDFLAGVFAPVALIWLVAAVFTQRQELNETRDQFKENQKVVDAQLKTINSQNELLQQQHRQAEESAKRAYRLDLFDKRFSIYSELVRIGDHFERNEVSETDCEALNKIKERSAFVFNQNVFDHIHEVMVTASDTLILSAKFSNYWFTVVDDDRGHQLKVDEQENIKKDLTAARKKLLERLDVTSLKHVMWSSMRVSDD